MEINVADLRNPLSSENNSVLQHSISAFLFPDSLELKLLLQIGRGVESDRMLTYFAHLPRRAEIAGWKSELGQSRHCGTTRSQRVVDLPEMADCPCGPRCHF